MPPRNQTLAATANLLTNSLLLLDYKDEKYEHAMVTIPPIPDFDPRSQV